MKMKKLSIITIIAIMVLSLSACGTSNNNNSKSGSGSTGSNSSGYNSSIIDNSQNSGTTNSGNTDSDKHYFNGTVAKVSGNEISVKPTKDDKSNAVDKIFDADEIKLNTSMVATDAMPDIKEGDKVRVEYNRDNFLEDMFKIDNVLAIYKIDDNGEVVSSR